MTRIRQTSNSRGSLKFIQLLINKNQSYINRLIKQSFSEIRDDEIYWLSPLEDDEYAEYRDDSFLNIIGFDPKEIELTKFWPRRGPQWDALAKTKTGKVILVEAKANKREIASSATKAKGKSKQLIIESLLEIKEFMQIKNDVDWSGKYYQYTNRLFHLFYLRIKCNKPVFLVNIYFTEENTVVSTTLEQFHEAIDSLNKWLGVKNDNLSDYIANIFIDVNDLKI
ncbi:hypothetical protein [Flavobacterium alkalisoli]|uniref:hypothetical protein n=1 Tax=Flavobacterium alkalisoli TaxID=2602769 RepID=UPI003A958F0A